MSLYTQLALAALLASIGGSFRLGRPPVGPADRIVLEKSARRLLLVRKDVAVRSYKVALGPKVFDPGRYRRGIRAPEGVYVVASRDDRGPLQRTLRLSDGGGQDAARSRRRHLFPNEDMAIHGIDVGWGLGALRVWLNRTEGCIAVGDTEIDEIWSAARIGTPVEIRP